MSDGEPFAPGWQSVPLTVAFPDYNAVCYGTVVLFGQHNF